MAAEVAPRVSGTAIDQEAIALDVDRRPAHGPPVVQWAARSDRIRSVGAVEAIVRLSL